jgi:hypothetical protein
MRSPRPIIMATTALVALSSAMPAISQEAATVALQPAQYLHLSDDALLEALVDQYRLDPSSYEKSIEYISLNRPAIQDKFLIRTAILEHILGAKTGPSAAAQTTPPNGGSTLGSGRWQTHPSRRAL